MASVPNSIKVGVPIVVSIVSLLFGAFQYFDKRGMERSLQEQQLRLNAADLIVYYLETDLASILALVGKGVPNLVSATTLWTEKVEKLLEVQDIQLQQTPVLLEIQRALSERRRPLGVGPFQARDPQISFLFIRNGGCSNAVDVAVAYETLDAHDRSLGADILGLGVIEAKRAVVVPIAIYEAGSEQPLISQIKPSRLKYTDASTGRAVAIEVRDKLRSPRYVTPRIRTLE